MEKTAIKAVIYARQSRTIDGSESIQNQIETCRLAAERMGVDVVSVLAEPPSTSGYQNRGRTRAKFKELLKGFENGDWQMVMAYKTDRLSRGGGPGWAPLLEAIEKANLDLDRSVATPSGFISEFEIGIRATMDREESKKHSERMGDNAARSAKQGLPHKGGRRVFGYKEDRITIEPSEAAVLREMAEMVFKGQSFKHIAWHLNEQGLRTTTGKLWYPITVRNMLRKPRFKGVRIYKGVEYKAIWEPIFDADTWERLQALLDIRAEAKVGVPKPRKYLLTGVLFCGACGMPLNGMTKRDNPQRPIRRTYQCRVQGDAVKKHGCGGVTRNADALEHWVRESIFAHLKSSAVLELLGVNEKDTGIIKGLLEDRRKQQERLDQLVDDYAVGLLTRPQLERAKSAANEELERIGRLLTRYASSNAVLSMLPVGKTVEEAWAEEPEDWKRALASSLIERVIVLPSVKKPFYPLPDGSIARFDPTALVIVWRSFQ